MNTEGWDDTAGVPAKVDLSPDMQPVADQGPLGTCLAFSVTAPHELARNELGDRQRLCVEFLYWAAKQRDGDRSEGTTFGSAGNALADTGQPPEELWPYEALRDSGAPGYAPPPEAMLRHNSYRALLRRIAPTLEAIRLKLAARRAVAIGIPLWDHFYTPRNDELDMPDRSELTGALHAVTVVGYDDATQRIRIRNSWGSGWGDSGYATLPSGFISSYVIEAWSIERVLDRAS